MPTNQPQLGGRECYLKFVRLWYNFQLKVAFDNREHACFGINGWVRAMTGEATVERDRLQAIADILEISIEHMLDDTERDQPLTANECIHLRGRLKTASSRDVTLEALRMIVGNQDA